MSQFQYEHSFAHSPEKIFAIFCKQFQQTFPQGNIKAPLGVSVSREASGIGGNTFRLELEISDYRENEVYEVSTYASNRQSYITRYELIPAEEGKTLMRLTEKITTPGFFGSGNAILTQIFFKRKAKQKAERLFQAIENELTRA
jgi:hypothetical protein